MKTLTLADIPNSLAELEAELGAIDQRLAQLCQALPKPEFDEEENRPRNASARIVRMLQTGRQEELELLRTRLRVARVQTQRLICEEPAS